MKVIDKILNDTERARDLIIRGYCVKDFRVKVDKCEECEKCWNREYKED